MNKPSAHQVVAECMIALPMHERVLFLKSLLAHAAAGLVISTGTDEAARTCYKVGAAVLSRKDERGGRACI